jgi:hypothetical protein
MLYTLPDGRELVLEDIVRVSKVRDQGDDEKSIAMSKMSFKIYLKNEKIIEINEKYHFSDWGKTKKDLEKTYTDLLDKWQKAVGGDKAD